MLFILLVILAFRWIQEAANDEESQGGTKQKEETAKAMETLEKAGKDFKEPPDYLSELHNRLALVTV